MPNPELNLEQMEFISFINKNKPSTWDVKHDFVSGTLYIHIYLNNFPYTNSHLARITYNEKNNCMTVSFEPHILPSSISFIMDMLKKQNKYPIFHIQD